MRNSALVSVGNPYVGIVTKTDMMVELAVLQRLADLTSSLDDAVRERQEEGMTDLYRFDMTPADGSLGYGTAMHPSLRQHTRMAEELTAYLRQIMNR